MRLEITDTSGLFLTLYQTAYFNNPIKDGFKDIV